MHILFKMNLKHLRNYPHSRKTSLDSLLSARWKGSSPLKETIVVKYRFSKGANICELFFSWVLGCFISTWLLPKKQVNHFWNNCSNKNYHRNHETSHWNHTFPIWEYSETPFHIYIFWLVPVGSNLLEKVLLKYESSNRIHLEIRT